MNNRHGFDWLGAGIAAVLRTGTVVAIGIIAVGYLIGLIAGFGDSQRPLVEMIGSGGAVTIVAVGLLALTLLPGAVLVAASIAFARNGERGRLLTSLGVLGLLFASLAAAALLAQAG